MGMTNARAEILGALLVQITLGNRISRVMMYICKEESGVILSESCVKDLGLLPENFPDQTSMSQSNATPTTECHCPRWTVTPPLPEKIPFPATKENRSKLESWI